MKPRPSAKTTSAPSPEAASQLDPRPPRRKVFLVDDHPLMLAGMRQLVESEPAYEVCGTARSAEEAFSALIDGPAELLITDLTLPGKGGLELIKDLHAARPELLILVVSMHDEFLYAERALRAGARGYLMKEASSEHLLMAMSAIFGGQVYVSPRMASRILAVFSGQASTGSKSPIEKLTDREFEVFRLLGEGCSTKEVAARLHLSFKTVNVHRSNIKEKLGLGSASELIHHAVQWVESQKNMA